MTAAAAAPSPDLWELARQNREVHRFSTLFTAQDVRGRLSNAEGLDAAVAWCKRTGVTKVYVEQFRDGYQAEREPTLRARERFLKEGIEPAGCITPTRVGKSSTGWKNTISCYTDPATQEKVRAIFEYSAGLFDEIMIDDFWFTDCACEACDAARRSRTVTIGGQNWPVAGDTWADYRGELMVRLSREYVLAAAKKVNPRARLIIKYPQWYDRFHERGYDVARQTADFDRIWVGTETRDYGDARWGGTVQYEAFFIMRWLGNLGGEKCGGGWFDPYGTTEKTYVEQARQTILGGARETVLFCYGSLLRDTGPANVEALRGEMPELLRVAGQVHRRDLVGVAAYKPPGSAPETEARVFDFVGMAGVPLRPCHTFPSNAPAAFFSIHALKDPAFTAQLREFIQAGKPVLLTDGLAQRLGEQPFLKAPHVITLPVKGDPKSLLQMNAETLESVRAPLLRPFKTTFSAPNQVSLYLFADGSWVVENFNDQAVLVRLNGQELNLPARAWRYSWRQP